MIAEEVLKYSLQGLDLCSDDYSLDNYLDEIKTDNKLRAKVSSVLFCYYRNKLSIEFIIKYFAKNRIKPKLCNLLSVAITQILYQTGIRPEVSVDVAVDYAKRNFGKKIAGFVNAVLRNVVKTKDNIDEVYSNAPDEVKINIPGYVLNRWKIFYTSFEVDRLAKIIKIPQTDLFYRFFKTADVEVIDGSEVIDIRGFDSAFKFYRNSSPSVVINSELLKTGKIYIQDPATSLSISSIKYSGKGNILDGCAAPGGKTLMLAELYQDSTIYAMDRSERRLEKVKQNLGNAGYQNVKIISGDVIQTSFESDFFNVVFLDVPCSNSGVLRKRPDVLWKLNEKHIKDIVCLQRRILDSSKRLVKSGGKLVYSTCSIEADENIYQIKDFLKRNENFQLEFQKQLLPELNNDGAFVAVMNKNK